ncbi:MAG: hypothetical protein ACP5N2_05295 [Candidatus Nanoarchaeia archaeon]
MYTKEDIDEGKHLDSRLTYSSEQIMNRKIALRNIADIFRSMPNVVTVTSKVDDFLIEKDIQLRYEKKYEDHKVIVDVSAVYSEESATLSLRLSQMDNLLVFSEFYAKLEHYFPNISSVNMDSFVYLKNVSQAEAIKINSAPIIRPEPTLNPESINKD